jgi:hypothetical protein
MKRLILALVVNTLVTALVVAENADIAAPVVAGGGGFERLKPEMYHSGWIDLNKNGVKDVYEDPSQPLEKRIADLMKRMSRQERIGQLRQHSFKSKPDISDQKLLAAGDMGSYLGLTSDGQLRNRLQRIAVEESPLGIPLIFGYDTIHGLNTVFPIPLALSASWDPSLVERVDHVAAAESAASGVDWVFADGGYCARSALGPHRGGVWGRSVAGQPDGRGGGQGIPRK